MYSKTKVFTVYTHKTQTGAAAHDRPQQPRARSTVAHIDRLSRVCASHPLDRPVSAVGPHQSMRSSSSLWSESESDSHFSATCL